MSDPFRVVRDFEAALCNYTGAPFAVTTNSCSMALLLAVAWHLRDGQGITSRFGAEHMRFGGRFSPGEKIEIPKRTYVSVPMSIIHAGGRPTFRDEDWKGWYQLRPLPIWDSARWFTSGLYNCMDNPSGPRVLPQGAMVCLSFHWSKTLGIQQGGAILHDDPEADKWLRQARFDGRIESSAPREQAEAYGFNVLGWHCYMSPEVAAAGLVRLHHLPRHNDPLPNDDYPDLSQMEIFK